ncbi:MAG: hypothetical protein A2V66_15110 [Ignavibacteria bacterium RBG_13_36_8]|nr:MAG: hypothetical protein A2V66_15110 [Ignavibacteria bacterium RBG_13_36_8]
MKIKTLKQNFLRFLGLYILSFISNVLLKTVKIRIHNSNTVENFIKQQKNFIVVFWHGTMLVPWFLHRDQNCAALVSQSKDGEILSRILKKWNYQVIRGSSHTGGKEALEILLDKTKKKFSIAITPDGPTGPSRFMKAGAVITAKKSNLPLILLGVAYAKKYKLNSWDKFEIPKLFSKIAVVYSEPIFVDQSLSYDATSEVINECGFKLNKLQEEAGVICLKL